MVIAYRARQGKAVHLPARRAGRAYRSETGTSHRSPPLRAGLELAVSMSAESLAADLRSTFSGRWREKAQGAGASDCLAAAVGAELVV